MASKFWSFWNGIFEKLGINKAAEDLTKKRYGFGDKQLDQTKNLRDKYFGINDDPLTDFEKEALDNTDVPDVADKIKAGTDFIDTSIDSIEKGGSWIKDQVEAETGAGANKTNKEIADQNLDFEREKFDYDKALQEKLFEREDTAYQRTVNDMRMAGLNPLNMQNTNGAGAAVATTAPHNDYQMQSTNKLQLLNMLFNASLQAKNTTSNTSLQQANANLLNAQADNQRIKNKYESDILSASLAGLAYDNQQKTFNITNEYKDYMFNKLMGWTKNMPDWMKQSSARLGYTPFKDNLDLTPGLKNPYDNYWFMGDSKFGINPDLSTKLLSDELLTGSLGLLGSLFKLALK